jgi:hypothetical protein
LDQENAGGSRSPIRLNAYPEVVVYLAERVDIHVGAVNGLNG